MTIHIDALNFDVIIGLLDSERDRPQKIIIDLKLTYDYKKNNFINYADIVILMQNEMKKKQYVLLEDAIDGVKTVLLNAYPQMHFLSLKISKPDILPSCSVALSSSWHFKA